MRREKTLRSPQQSLILIFPCSSSKHSQLQTNTPCPAKTCSKTNWLVQQPPKTDCVQQKLTEEPSCRFCASDKEPMNHLVDCPHLVNTLGAVPNHELEQNLKVLGIVEHPFKIAEHRLRRPPPPEVTTDQFQTGAQPLKTAQCCGTMCSGSTGAFAVVNKKGLCLAKRPVLHCMVSFQLHH